MYHLLFLFFLHCPLSGPVLTSISLLIIPRMIVYVTNKQEPWTLNLEPWNISGSTLILRSYANTFCAQKKKTLFNNFFSSMSVFATRSQQHACGAADIEPRCTVACVHTHASLYSCKHMSTDTEENNCWINSLFLFSLRTKNILVTS